MGEAEAERVLKAAGADEVGFKAEFDVTGVGVVVGAERHAVAGRRDKFDLAKAVSILREWVEKHVAGKPLRF